MGWLRVALDATYSTGRDLSGVGMYSRSMLYGLARFPARWLWCYRAHRFGASLRERLPHGCARRLLWESYAPAADLFHGLNQRLPKAGPRRSVATFHDLFVLTADYSTSEFRRRFALQAREAAQRASLLIAVSRFTASQLQDLLGVEKARIRVIGHGVRLPPASPSPSRELVVLTVGAVQRRKNTLRLVEAFEQTPPGWRLVIAGGFGFGAEQILRRIADSPRRADIEVTGYVSASRLAELYRTASVFAFPSLDEGFGMPVLEAMAHGLPVVTSNRSALPEVAEGAALLVDPLDTEALAAAISTLMADAGLRQDLERRGLQRAAQHSWDQALEATWRVYGELA